MGTVVFLDEKINWGINQKVHEKLARSWFDLEQYYKYHMSCLGGEDFSFGPQKEQFTEIRWWMQDNLEGEIVVKYDDNISTKVYLYFQHEADLMAFKLRWM